MATASDDDDESGGTYSDEDRIRKKKPKSKSKTKSSKRRRHRRRHSSLSSSYSSDSDSDDYNSRKRDKPKKKRRRKEKELAKSGKKKSQTKKKKKRRRHDTPSASSSSPVRSLKSRKRRRSLSRSPSCSTCSSRGRSPSMDGCREERLPKSPDATEERWEERDKVIEAYDDYQSSRKDEREADAAGNEELGETRFASVVQSAIGDVVVMEEEEKRTGVGNARLASVVGSTNYDMAVEEEEVSAGSGDNAGKDAVALELILRQKALENFRKFRVGLSVNKEFDKPAVDRRIGSSDEGGSIPNQPIKVHGFSDVKSLEQSQSGLSANKGFVGNRVAASSSDVGIATNQVKKVQGSTNRMVLSEQTTTGAKVAQDKKLVAEPDSGKVHISEVSVGDKKEAVKPAKEGNFRNLNSTETFKPTVSRTFSKPIEGGTMQNEAKVEESSNRLLSEQAMLAKVAKDKALVTETGRDKVHTGPASIGDGSIPPDSCPIKDDENCKSNEPMVNSATGSEFEQKTFCRVRDGETVQVKYKVYIPKKTPALARRKLQR
ncbi:pre-mRNA-splicing factor CWC22-like protein [Iris pallida]|uniref:Pre-mRNA-splicing factor CWC22-like protein n=1 Tax=Iris pallida TaxID=29817 RepID=A0AAX6DPX1_IRIPA|nr:pre-mRNA-splicing factor CWC22-like protein [Iris pallida]